RDRGVGHRDRAHHAAVGVRPQHEERRAHHMGTRAFLAPREACDLSLDRALQQYVPGGIELDLVDAVAVAIVRLAGRQISLGPAAVLERLDTARLAAGLARELGAPATPFALERLLEGAIDLEQVDGLERRGLIQDRTGGVGVRAGGVARTGGVGVRAGGVARTGG